MCGVLSGPVGRQARPSPPSLILGTNGKALEAADAGFAHRTPPKGTTHNRGRKQWWGVIAWICAGLGF